MWGTIDGPLWPFVALGGPWWPLVALGGPKVLFRQKEQERNSALPAAVGGAVRCGIFAVRQPHQNKQLQASSYWSTNHLNNFTFPK